MLIRKAQAQWGGDLVHGNGRLAVGSGALDLPYSFKARFEDGQPDTNPEELRFVLGVHDQAAGERYDPIFTINVKGFLCDNCNY